LHLGIFEHPAKTYFFSNQLGKSPGGHVPVAGGRSTGEFVRAKLKTFLTQQEEDNSKRNHRTMIGYDSLKGGMKCER
jgi:hypothetical protein